MNRCSIPFFLSCIALFGTLSLSGCSGFDSASLAHSSPDQVTVGKIQGSVFGGHAPIVGSQVFLLQAGVGGYGTAATSLLSATFETGSAFPTTKDTSGDATNGDFHVNTDSTGSFNISGDYTCSAGLPVYLYASGGTSAVQPNSAITAYSIADADGGDVVTFTSNNLLSAGQQVTVSGIPDATLDTTFAVVTSTLTSFTVSLTHADVAKTPVTATATPVLTSNPAIVQLAVLGNCPTSGAANFSSISFIYMNEVSTVAAAYSLSSFFSNSATALTSTDAAHLAIPGGAKLTDAAALVGIKNAANNAAQLYDIQGNGPIGTGGDGDTHIANATTPSGGTVPQALVNSLANTLAACVDSNNSATTQSAACADLFNKSMSAGETGTAPTDIATAAINMAHNPWNPMVTDILGIAGSTVVPFLPVASSAHDLAIGIFWKVNPTGFSQINPTVAIDAQGNPWYLATQTGSVSLLTPLGALTINTVLNGAVHQAIDTHGNDWVSVTGLGQGIAELNSDGAVVSGSPFLTTAFGNAAGIAIDGNNNSIFIANESSQGTEEITPLSNANPPAMMGMLTGGGCSRDPFNLALDGSPTPNLWTLSSVSSGGFGAGVCKFIGTTNGLTFGDLSGFVEPQDIAIDSSGNAWVTDGLATAPGGLFEISPNGAKRSLQGGDLNLPHGLAIDGSGLIFTGNLAGTGGGGAIAIFNPTTTGFITGTSGLTGSYMAGAAEVVMPAVILQEAESPTGLAIDESGDLWVANSNSLDLTEILGVATPVLTPLSAAMATGKPASRP